MKYFIFLILVIIGCVTSADNSGSGQLSERYFDGCYYIITTGGGITAKINQPSGCRE